MTRILVVDDEPDIRDELVDWLIFEGYEVASAENGRRALAEIERAAPDLIISDIRMPVMDGYELLLEIRSNPNLLKIPFIFLTASAERESVRRGMDQGADDYLTKPFTHAEIMHAVQARLQKKQVQDQLTQANLDALNTALGEEREKRLLKSRLVAMFSHDFRNPLSSILFSSYLLRTGDDRLSPERRQQHLDRIDSAIHLLIQMLEDMMMVAEMEGGYLKYNPQDVDLTSFVNNIVDEFRTIDQNNHVLTVTTPPMDLIEGDPKLLRQILANLLSNALKYSPAGTKVQLILESRRDKIRLIVQDQGIGIPAEDLPQLFTPFYRAENAKSEKGTGLGLNIVKTCVDLHNGEICVESKVGEGTKFIVEIPNTPGLRL